MTDESQANRSSRTEQLWRWLRVVLPLAFVAWLVWNGWPDIQRFRRETFHFGYLTAAFGLLLLAQCVTIVRWYWLARALKLDFRVRDAFRLGFLAYLFNYVSLGSVGGDLFKAFFIAREQPGRRVDAIASVVVDRVIGLYGLLLVASTAIVLFTLQDTAGELATLCQIVFGVTVAATFAIPLVILLGLANESFANLLANIPIVGPLAESVFAVLRRYLSRPGTLTAACLASVGTQCLICCAVYLTARSIFIDVPTVGEHFFIVPLSEAAGALPLTPSGLGTFDYTLKYLYESFSTMKQDLGMGVALAFRLMEIGIAVIGAGYYMMCRRDVADVVQAAKSSEQEDVGQDRASLGANDNGDPL